VWTQDARTFEALLDRSSVGWTPVTPQGEPGTEGVGFSVERIDDVTAALEGSEP
jgi:hypothetical protein